MTKQSEWASYLKASIEKAGGFKEWLEKKMESHSFVYKVLKQLLPSSGKMLEIGCGLAATSIAMNKKGFQNTATDIDNDVLKLAKQLSSIAGASVSFKQADMFDLTSYYNKFDLVYSGGVLEHLDQGKVIQLLQEQSKVAPTIVAVIPTKSELKAAPIKRYYYSTNDLRDFGERAGLKTVGIFYFKGTIPHFYQTEIEKVDKPPAERIGIVYKSV
jgi:2-polyprenyl-3-methyl-5-hydroxy-6-metoxy-1,4-benzoquinol methylase